ncbi:MAG: hypothetical protein CL470_07155 [Acidimicrobiaceae bacterium]|nr:hypothetical protein [Acidimicrobiaceae bacterium]
MIHRFPNYVMALFLTLLLSCVLATPAASEEQPNTSKGVEIIKVDDGSGIIPKPGSGVAPESPTDRGGALQLGLLGLLLLFPVVAIMSVRRQARKNKLPAKA